MQHRTSAYQIGSEKVSAPVSKSVSFRAVVDAKVPLELLSIAAEASADERAKAYGSFLKRSFASLTKYQVETADVVLFGKTKNNLREFDFLIELLKEHNVDFSLKSFLSDFLTSKNKSPSFEGDLITEIIEFSCGYARGSDVTSAHLWQHYQYTKTYLSILSSYWSLGYELPKLGVVANDHSPAQVAFKAAMDSLNVPVLYIQHAEVSDAFPPLDFAVSILRNEISREIYMQLGPLNGEIFVLSRNRKDNAFRDVIGSVSARASVGLYPTSRFDPVVIRETVQNLNNNALVDDVFVKLHPNTSTKLSEQDLTTFRVENEFPRKKHVALVGNSSVVVDLLARGVPVFHLYKLDDIVEDYYGFERNGLSPSVHEREISRKAFWQQDFYNKEWLSRALKFDPAIAENQDGERRRAAKSIDRIIRARRAIVAPERSPADAKLRLKRYLAKAIFRVFAVLGARFPKQIRWLGDTISTAVQTSNQSAPDLRQSKKKRLLAKKNARQALMTTLMDEVGDSRLLFAALLSPHTTDATRLDLISWFDARWAERDIRAYDIVRSYAAILSAESDLWVRLLCHEIMAVPVSETDASNFVNQIENVTETQLRRRYENSALRLMLRNGHLGHFFKIIHNSPVFNYSSLSANFKVEIARAVGSESYKGSTASAVEFWASLTEFEKVKIKAAGVLNSSDEVSHLQLEDHFARLTTDELSRDFQRIIRPVFDRLRSQMKFMDVRTNENQRSDLFTSIVKAVSEQRPLSMLRMGDGEAYLFNSSDGPFSDEDRAMRERHWWNVSLSQQMREEIQRSSLEALRCADILGVPSVHRFFRDYSERSKLLLGSTANRGIVTAVLNTEKLVTKRTLITEDRVHHLIFKPEQLRALISAANRTIVVSSVRADLIRKHLETYCRKLITIEIPTHAKTKGNPVYVSWSEPFPFVRSSIEEKLSSVVEPGDLVLVSAGVAGKGMVGVAKRQGAIGLDLGGQIEALVEMPNGALF